MKTTRLHSRARSDSPGAGQAGCLYFWAESLLKHRALMMRAMYIRALSAPAFSELCRGFVGVFKGVFKGYSNCIPQWIPLWIPLPWNRYLYHFIGEDTPKDTDIDTMSVFFLFAVSSVEDANIGWYIRKSAQFRLCYARLTCFSVKTSFHPFSPSA